MFMWGHAPNSQTRGEEMKKAMEKLDLLVVVDPYPTVSAVMHDRTDGVYLLPACTQFETYGSVTASNRSLQWRDKVIDPLFESLPDHTIMYKLAKKLGFEEQLFKHIEVNGEEPLIEDITREFNRGMWTIGYTGQSPERLKLHQQHWGTFDYTSLKAEGGPADGDFYGMPWPCWGTAEMKHPGTPNLYDTSVPVAEGGLTFRARFGVERDGVSLLADGSYSAGSDIKDGYPEFTARHAEEARLVGRSDGRGTGRCGGQELEDRPVRRHPASRDQARLRAVRQRQGPHDRLDLPGPGTDPSRTPVYEPP